jgi:parallel beta-helix repeat protein
MATSISRRDFMHRVGAVGTVAGSVVASGTIGANARASDVPDPAHILRRLRGWTVLPNGGDNHDNLEWALRNTAPGDAVMLVPGVYKIGSPIVVADFDGTLAGAGVARTTITCTDEFSYELWQQAGGDEENRPPDFPRVPVDGSLTKTPPTLMQFYKTPLRPGEDAADRANRIVIRDLRCRGAMRGSPWMFGDEVLSINILNSTDWENPDSAPATTRQDVTILRIEVDGYSTPAFGPFANACACITVLGGPILTSDYNLNGDEDGDAVGFANGGLLGVTPAEGNVTFQSCTFRNCRFGPGVVGYRDGTVQLLDNTTDGCRGNCLQMVDLSNVGILVRGNDLFCDAILLPPELAAGAMDLPSSLGCVVALQGLGAVIGYPYNVQFLALASDPAAHEGRPEAGPVGTWRPQGRGAAPRRSEFSIVGNGCQSSPEQNTYCIHTVDAANLAFGAPALSALVRNNTCAGSETCISLEHIEGGRVISNECSSQAFGIELYDSRRTLIARNSFDFPAGVHGCEIRELALGEKLDLSRVVSDHAGVCVHQG